MTKRVKDRVVNKNYQTLLPRPNNEAPLDLRDWSNRPLINVTQFSNISIQVSQEVAFNTRQMLNQMQIDRDRAIQARIDGLARTTWARQIREAQRR